MFCNNFVRRQYVCSIIPLLGDSMCVLLYLCKETVFVFYNTFVRRQYVCSIIPLLGDSMCVL